MHNSPPNPIQVVQALIAKEEHVEPMDLAKKWGISVHIGRWFPTTWGEYDRRHRSIQINELAPIPLRNVLAHELGHAWLHQQGWSLPLAEEEAWVETFAETLIKHTIHDERISPQHGSFISQIGDSNFDIVYELR